VARETVEIERAGDAVLVSEVVVDRADARTH
jgi:hypothetical protein